MGTWGSAQDSEILGVSEEEPISHMSRSSWGGIGVFAQISWKDAVSSLLLRLGGPSGHRLERRGKEKVRVVFWRC